ncbi:unnamed protein product [Cuscuta epithymum]
MKGFP